MARGARAGGVRVSARFEITITSAPHGHVTRATESDLTGAIAVAFSIAEHAITDGPTDNLPPADRVRVQITRTGVSTTEICDLTLTQTNPGDWS